MAARLLVESRPPLKSSGGFAATAGRVARVEPATSGQSRVGLENRVLQRSLPLVLRVAQLQQPRLLQKDQNIFDIRKVDREGTKFFG